MNNSIEDTKVKIVSITKSMVDGIDSADEFMAYAARVSNPDNQMNSETAPKLIKYLIDNKHWSPLEMVNICVEVETTRDIGRQLLRHSMKFQEFSGRYQNMNKLGFTLRECRLQDTKNRQNSLPCEDPILVEQWAMWQKDIIECSKAAYDWAIEHGIAKEQARAVLPEGLTKSKLYANGSLRSWYHYCQVRMDESTQKEHRVLAEMIWNEIVKEFPSIGP